jgi:hypothetical protein
MNDQNDDNIYEEIKEIDVVFRMIPNIVTNMTKRKTSFHHE